MEYTKEQYLADLNDMKSKLEADFQAKADAKTSEMEQKHTMQIDELKKAIEEAKNIKPEVTAEDLKSFRDQYELDMKAIDKSFARVKATPVSEKKEARSFAENLKYSLEEATDSMEKFNRKEIKSFSVEIKAVGDMSTANVTTGTRYGQVMAPGIIEIPKRKVHLRSLIPNGTVGAGNTYTFMREASTGEGAPAAVAEGAAKAQFDLDLEEANVNIETIAGFVRVTKKAMNNIPGFISYLQSRLPELLLRTEDAEILYGSGSTPHLKGLLTSGNFTAANSTATNLIEQIIDSIAQLEDGEEREANGILMRPKEYYNFFKQKAAGSGEYDLPQNVAFIDGVLYVSGVPAYASTAVTDGDYTVGDFRMGAQFLIQEGMRIEFFEQDADNVTKNKVTVRIEETVALPVFGSNYFIKGAVPA